MPAEHGTMSSKPMDAYLGTNAMRATQSSMSLVSSILGFEIVELWTQEAGEKLHCTYVHAQQELLKKYPDLIHGHYPNHKKEHKLSSYKLDSMAKHFLKDEKDDVSPKQIFAYQVNPKP